MSFTPPFSWQPGEHLAVAGRTGSGKSTLMSHLLTTRRYVLVLKTKPDRVTYPGFKTMAKARAMDDPRNERLVLYPRYEEQQEQIGLALERVWTQGGWTVYADELFYLTKMLGLGLLWERLVTQARSKGVSCVSGMQRPVQVTRFAISESTHVLSFFLEGRDARETMAQAASPVLADATRQLQKFQFAWFYQPNVGSQVVTDKLWVGRLQDLERGAQTPQLVAAR